MSIINVLDFKTANLIAAGEVVERPASVVKELVENSIDAGAKKVTVEIRGGGVAMIRVTDDGCGMSEDDLPRCILRHATSKIATGDDLAAISTLGFRGEALAATAAVSRMKIATKRRQDDTGHSISVTYGVCSKVSEAGTPDGTVVTVTELFSNVPARRKFLKQDRTEAAAVASVCEKLALSTPGVSLTLISDGVRRFSTAGDGDLKSAVYAVLGRQFATGLIPVNGTTEGITVTGGVAPPVLARSNRAMELFFINGRYVKSQVIASALEQALVSFVPAEKFPAAVLFLTLDPSSVDVNVHPSKLEVKFSSDRPVFDAVYYAVKASTAAGVRPELDPALMKKTVSPFTPVTDEYTKTEVVQLSAFDQRQEPKPFVPPQAEVTSGVFNPELRATPFTQNYTEDDVRTSSLYGTPKEKEPEAGEPRQDAPQPEVQAYGEEWRYIGEAFDTYLFVQQGDDVLIIDKHAAHERLRFEALKAAMKARTPASQMRMIPITVAVTAEEADAAQIYTPQLSSTGYGFEMTDEGIDITRTPANLDDGEAKELFIGMLSELAENEADPEHQRDALFEKALYQVCCKGAIKGGEKNDEEALKALISELLAHPEVTYCPHGRPVAFRMSRAAIERRFGRT
ncbi:MAG: DNA mismatch repair endonuclease MutL [Clostridia bacterium]|nr:DNA mismatch repair endonuclease MutL [Clostridia bacterium]